MATSNSIDYNETRDEIIKDALMAINVLGANEALGPEDLNLGTRQLNRMIKQWQGKGIWIWTHEEAVLYPNSTNAKYEISPTATTHSSLVSDEITTALNGGENLGSTTLTVDSTTGMAASDYIGIELSDNTRQWTTIVSVDSSTALTITDSLTESADDNSTVYTYTTKLNRPMEILEMREVIDGGTHRTINLFSEKHYFDIVEKDLTSSISGYYYRRKRDGGEIYLWPRVDDVKTRLYMTIRRQIHDFDSANNNPDFPQEWLNALVFNLALQLAPFFGKEPRDIVLVANQAQDALMDALGYDQDPAPVKFTPDTGDYT